MSKQGMVDNSICSDAVFSNGALHWLVAEEGQSPENIVAFDLATEKFRVITTPLKAPMHFLCDMFGSIRMTALFYCDR